MYNEVIKRAIDNYRKKNTELINEISNKSYYKNYDKKKHTEAYMTMNRERSRLYREKQKLLKLQKIEQKIEVETVAI
jgi:Fe-S cluster biosynthesis and repair protein YggX